MWRYSTLALALVAGAFTGGAAAAQRIVVPDDFDISASQAAASSAANAASKPARPTNLRGRALSTSESVLTWHDAAANESEFLLDVRWDARPWEELGSVPANAHTLFVVALEPGTTYYFRMRARNGAGYSAYSNEGVLTAFFEPGSIGPCTPAAGVLCLRDGRYRVQALYEGGGKKGAAAGVPMSQETGFFWFFTPGNVEVLVKLIDGCELNKHNWVFVSGLTNMRVQVLVIDTQTGATTTYVNEADKAFQVIQDTDALSGCAA